jgi:hypothetical protein
MTHARPFWTSTLQEISNDIKNTPMQGVLTPAIKLLVFRSPGGLQVPNFGSVSFILTLGQSGVATNGEIKVQMKHMKTPFEDKTSRLP